MMLAIRKKTSFFTLAPGGYNYDLPKKTENWNSFKIIFDELSNVFFSLLLSDKL